MTRGRRLLRGTLVVALLLGFAMLALVLRARSFDAGTPPPLSAVGDLTVTRDNGTHAHLRDLIDPTRPTIINLWATWCGPCRRELPLLADLYRQRRGEITIVLLNVRDPAATPATRRAYLASLGLPRATDVVLADRDIPRLAGTADALVPRTLAWNAAGVPVARITGYRPLALARLAALE